MKIVIKRGKYHKLPRLWLQWHNPYTNKLHHNRLSEYKKVKNWQAEAYNKGFRLGLTVGKQTKQERK